MSEEKSRGLTRREFDAVIRRAAELASSGPDASEGNLTEAEVFRIARDLVPGTEFVADWKAFEAAIESGEEETMRATLRRVVPEYATGP